MYCKGNEELLRTAMVGSWTTENTAYMWKPKFHGTIPDSNYFTSCCALAGTPTHNIVSYRMEGDGGNNPHNVDTNFRGTAVAVQGDVARGSRTLTLPAPSTENTQPQDESTRTGNTYPLLRLRLTRRRRVQWTQDTHDNEHDGKQSSKSCCIFHKKRAFDESSTESDEDHSSHDDSSEGEGSSSSSGGQPRRDTSSYVRGKLEELEQLKEATRTTSSQ